MGYRERRLARADRLRGWADKRAAKSAAAFTGARRALDGIEPGQPILVGHHSEKRHRAALDRHDSRMRQGFDSQELASSMNSRADNIEAAAASAIYSDDVDAVDRLREKIAGLDAERERIKAVNNVLFPLIKAGSKVTIVNRFGQPSTGRAVMRGPAGWVLNLGGRYGTPGIATPENTTAVKAR